MINMSFVLDFVIQFGLIFICTFIGAYTSQIHSLLNNKISKIQVERAILMCTTETFIIISMSQELLDYMGVNIFITFCFLTGAYFYKIVDRVFDGSILRLFFTILIKAKKDIFESFEDFIEDDLDRKRLERKNQRQPNDQNPDDQ